MKSQIVCAAPLGVALVALVVPGASAQNRCKWNLEASAADTKYTQQLAIDVGDIPGHQVRVFEVRRVFPNAKPNCEGLKSVESWTRGYSDYVDRNGRAWGYFVTTLENGDKIFGEFNATT